MRICPTFPVHSEGKLFTFSKSHFREEDIHKKFIYLSELDYWPRKVYRAVK